jgi:hypothetical protein
VGTGEAFWRRSPQIELLLGEQPHPPLGPSETLNRFQPSFRISWGPTRSHLVYFWTFQWAGFRDVESLAAVFTSTDVRHLL